MIDKEFKKRVEVKSLYQTFASVPTVPGTLGYQSLPAAGTGEQQRIGNDIYIKSQQIFGSLVNPL